MNSSSSRVEEAFVFAARVHADQYRKQSKIPYITHLMAVAALVGEYGGDEDQMIAALLHDAPEDQGGREQLQKIQDRFGPRVAAIVAGCTDTFDDPKPPWRPRKEAYITHLATVEPDVLLVSAADKLHNAGSTLRDLRIQGNSVFDRFNGKQAGTLWYYNAIVAAYKKTSLRVANPDFDLLINELDIVVKELEKQAQANASS